MSALDIYLIYTPKPNETRTIQADNARIKKNWARYSNFMQILKLSECKKFLILKRYAKRDKAWVLTITLIILASLFSLSGINLEQENQILCNGDIKIEKTVLNAGNDLAFFYIGKVIVLFGENELVQNVQNNHSSDSGSNNQAGIEFNSSEPIEPNTKAPY